MFYNLILYIYSSFLNDIVIKGLNMTYEDEEVKGFSEVYKYITEHICNTD